MRQPNAQARRSREAPRTPNPCACACACAALVPGSRDPGCASPARRPRRSRRAAPSNISLRAAPLCPIIPCVARHPLAAHVGPQSDSPFQRSQTATWPSRRPSAGSTSSRSSCNGISPCPWTTSWTASPPTARNGARATSGRNVTMDGRRRWIGRFCTVCVYDAAAAGQCRGRVSPCVRMAYRMRQWGSPGHRLVDCVRRPGRDAGAGPRPRRPAATAGHARRQRRPRRLTDIHPPTIAGIVTP